MKHLKLILTLLLLNLFEPLQLEAQTNDIRNGNLEVCFPVIDEILTNYAKEKHLPGMAYGLVANGKLVHTGQFGYTNISKKTPADSTSAFRIASMTKSFTTMAIVKLRDDGKLKLDDPVYLYIPEMKNQKYLTSDAAPITIRHLMIHAAGFPEDNPWGDRQLAISNEDLIDFLKKGISFSNIPGQNYEYSNLGYALLGYIIKEVSGLSYQNYITQNILNPLGMTHTYWEYTDVPAEKLAQGYRWVNEAWVEQPLLHDGAYGAMGGLITSLEDFSKYVGFHLSAWPARNEADNGPVKRSSIREMQFPWHLAGFNAQYKYPSGRLCPTVSAYAYGLGWRKDCEDRVYVGHSGGLPGFGSIWRTLPDYNIGIIAFGNVTYASFPDIQLLDTIVAIAKLKPLPLPVSAILNQRKNELIKLLPNWKNLEATNIFAENFFMDYFPDALQKEARSIFKKAGKIIRIHDLVPENNLRGTFIMEGENSNIEISFTLTPEKTPLIQEYIIKGRKK